MGFDIPKLGDLVDKGKEIANKVATEASKDFQEFHEWSRYKIASYEEDGKRLAERYSQETKIDEDHAETVAKLAEQTRDPETITRYLTGKKEGKLDGKTQKSMLTLGDSCYFDNTAYGGETRGSGDQETVKDLYSELTRTGGELNDDRYLMRYGHETDRGKWQNRAPEYLAALNPSQQAQAYEMNPLAYARTFPSSPLVKGETLARIVAEEIKQIGNNPEVRAANQGQLGRKTETTLLHNPNLSPEQKKAICKAITEIRIDDNTSKSWIGIDNIVRNVAANSTYLKDLVTIVNKFYGSKVKLGYMSETTYELIAQRAERAKANGKIDEKSYKTLINAKMFVPGQSKPTETATNVS